MLCYYMSSLYSINLDMFYGKFYGKCHSQSFHKFKLSQNYGVKQSNFSWKLCPSMHITVMTMWVGVWKFVHEIPMKGGGQGACPRSILHLSSRAYGGGSFRMKWTLMPHRLVRLYGIKQRLHNNAVFAWD